MLNVNSVLEPDFPTTNSINIFNLFPYCNTCYKYENYKKNIYTTVIIIKGN